MLPRRYPSTEPRQLRWESSNPRRTPSCWPDPPVPFYAGQLLINPETRFSDDLDHVPQVRGSVLFNLGLLRPRHVVRPEQALRMTGNSTPAQGLTGAEFFPHRQILQILSVMLFEKTPILQAL